MKIGIVCYPTYGGSGVLATELGIGLSDKGYEVHFITYQKPVRLNAFHQNIYFHEVESVDYPLFEYAPYESALASKMVDVVKYEKLDILHVHYAIPHATVAFLAKKILAREGIHIPVITTLHGTDITLVGINKTFTPIIEFSIDASDGVTAVSNDLSRQTKENFNIKHDIRVIHNFINLNRFKKSNKDHFKKAIAPNGEKIIVHTSNFRPVKRVGDVIDVFRRITNVLPAKLLLIGDGPMRSELEERARKCPQFENIRFLGKQDAVEEILAISDLFLMPSEKESFGLAALEAMACEVPVISSNAGGIPEVNIHGITGYLSNIGDVDDMAKNALYLLENPEILQQFRQNAFRQAQKFDINNILPLYINYYEEMITGVKAKTLV
ncbi:MAG: N-acetyl-alpha-D-glucosaminyl L-malate synthase BshA [Saprospiraceae bacterium]|nr:N-acetyl-alpha-D-glucosaminyl L-malate synthase BshA [Saprospiraceae bacterium]